MKYTDEDLIRYADGSLDTERAERLVHYAENDPELAEALSALDASHLPYKAAFTQNNIPPVPPALKAKIADLVSVSRADTSLPKSAKAPRWQILAFAACVLFGFIGGFLSSTLTEQSNGNQSLVSNADLSVDDIKWVNRVAQYQSLYVPNTVKLIKNDQQKTQHLLDSITENTGLQTRIPDFSTQGYQFVRAQELGYEGKTLVQLVYRKEGKSPLALCFMPADAGNATDVTLTQHAKLGAAYWRQQGQRFVIVADESEFALLELHSKASATWL